MGVSVTKSWERSRMFRYGLPEDFFCKAQKTTGGVQGSPPPLIRGLRGAQVRRNFCCSTCSMHLITARAVTNQIFFSEKTHLI